MLFIFEEIVIKIIYILPKSNLILGFELMPNSIDVIFCIYYIIIKLLYLINWIEDNIFSEQIKQRKRKINTKIIIQSKVHELNFLIKIN